MKKYRVPVVITHYGFVEVESETPEFDDIEIQEEEIEFTSTEIDIISEEIEEID